MTFLIDVSPSDRKQLDALKNFAKTTIQSLPADQYLTLAQCAVLTVGNSTSLVAYLTQYRQKNPLLSAIDNIQVKPAPSNYFPALQYLKLLVYANGYGQRPGSARVAVLLLDTSSYNSLSYNSYFNATIAAANDARAINVTLMVVAVGDAYPTPLLKAIAGNADNIVYVSNYADLGTTSTFDVIRQKVELAGNYKQIIVLCPI